MRPRKAMNFVTYLSLIAGFLFLSACGKIPGATSIPTVTIQPTAVNTPVPLKTLVICIGQEPESLYLYGSSSRSMWSVLEAIYDGPIDTVNYEASPVIVNELPTVENGGVVINSVAVTAGDEVANIEGDIVALKKGERVFAEGCTSPDCATEWDGVTPLNLTQMVAKFSLKEGIKWSDGKPLTAEDSVFSYQVSSDPATKVTKANINRTAAYTALDEKTIEWTGKPGYLTINPAAFFWIPLPKHLYSNFTALQMSNEELTTRKPVGWGAYMLDEWTVGDHIRLVKNPNYYRSAEGLPKFDVVVYRFLNGIPEVDISPIVTGECDIIDSSVSLETQIQPIRELELNGKAKAYFGIGPEAEVLSFGIKPASYDDIYNPYVDRPDFFGDVRVRQAIAYCVDREKINSTILYSQSQVPATYLAPNHPYAAKDLLDYRYDPEIGKQLLNEVGWVVDGENGNSTRVSSGVANLFEGTELQLSYYVTESELHAKTTAIVVDSLAECGIKVNPTYLGVEDMYATGPSGVIFGRNFDFAELAWSTGRQPPCFLYSTSEIPDEQNKWLGTKYGGVNFTGYANKEYDAACTESLTAGLNKELLIEKNLRMQQILLDELPVLPLFYHVKAALSRSDLCGLVLDVSARSAIKNLEEFELALTCPAK